MKLLYLDPYRFANEYVGKIEESDLWQHLRFVRHFHFFVQGKWPKPPELQQALKAQVHHYLLAKSDCRAGEAGKICPLEIRRRNNNTRKEWNKLISMYLLAKKFYPEFTPNDVFPFFPPGSTEKPTKGVKVKRLHLLPLLP
ncbi:MAG TPA: hypothetical protein VHZ04_00475 [Candidatus Paceibacterota bacterium]|jgi:hypothetical protein|nr:hypothetical protein [Candidatus Paceibacterota bacterium]